MLQKRSKSLADSNQKTLNYSQVSLNSYKMLWFYSDNNFLIKELRSSFSPFIKSSWLITMASSSTSYNSLIVSLSSSTNRKLKGCRMESFSMSSLWSDKYFFKVADTISEKFSSLYPIQSGMTVVAIVSSSSSYLFAIKILQIEKYLRKLLQN